MDMLWVLQLFPTRSMFERDFEWLEVARHPRMMGGQPEMQNCEDDDGNSHWNFDTISGQTTRKAINNQLMA